MDIKYAFISLKPVTKTVKKKETRVCHNYNENGYDGLMTTNQRHVSYNFVGQIFVLRSE